MSKRPEIYKSGFIALIGAPNVGKSTLLNRILGQKVSITSAKPQTTRNRILGVRHFPGGQMVFLDTPGIHVARSKLNRRLVTTAHSTLNEVDAVFWVVDACHAWGESEALILTFLERLSTPVFLCVNKIDLVDTQTVSRIKEEFAARRPFQAIAAVSALRGPGVEALVKETERVLPEGPPYFPQEMITDLSERFLAGEIVREKAMRLLAEEIPYAVAVTVEGFKEKPDGGMVVIQTTIHVERGSQKSIVIGKKGSMLKRIGTEARKDLEKLLGTRVYLELFVRVQDKWRQKDPLMDEFGY